MKHYDKKLADGIETLVVTGSFTLLKMYLRILLIIALVLFGGGFIVSFVFTHLVEPAHAEDYSPLAPYKWTCVGLNMTCAPVDDRLSYTRASVASVESVVRQVTTGAAGMSMGDGTRDTDYTLAVLLHDRAKVPYADIVWVQEDSDPQVGALIVRTTKGDYCACMDQDDHLYGPLDRSFFDGMTAYLQQDPEF